MLLTAKQTNKWKGNRGLRLAKISICDYANDDNGDKSHDFEI